MFVQDVAAGIRCVLSVETSKGAAGCSLVQTVNRNCLWHALQCWCWGCDLPVLCLYADSQRPFTDSRHKSRHNRASSSPCQYVRILAWSAPMATDDILRMLRHLQVRVCHTEQRYALFALLLTQTTSFETAARARRCNMKNLLRQARMAVFRHPRQQQRSSRHQTHKLALPAPGTTCIPCSAAPCRSMTHS